VGELRIDGKIIMKQPLEKNSLGSNKIVLLKEKLRMRSSGGLLCRS
jgi:hypothetical protein